MLTSILKSKLAVEANIRIANTFIEMRRSISEEFLEDKFYKNLILQNTEDIKKINATLQDLANKKIYHLGTSLNHAGG